MSSNKGKPRRSRSRRRNGRSRASSDGLNLVFQTAHALRKEGELDAALVHLEGQGDFAVLSQRIQALKAEIYSEKGDHQRALDTFQRAARLSGPGRFKRKIGYELTALSQFSEAEQVLYELCADKGSFDSKRLMALGHLYEEWCKEQPELLELALVCFREAAEHVDWREDKEETAAFENLEAQLGRIPETREIDAIKLS